MEISLNLDLWGFAGILQVSSKTLRGFLSPSARLRIKVKNITKNSGIDRAWSGGQTQFQDYLLKNVLYCPIGKPDVILEI